jgi:phospholipid/cholesterol/gamma-HCH transport system substrate-binding protein
VSRSLSRWQAILLGIVVIAGLAGGGIGLFAVGSRQLLWADTFQIQAGFPGGRGIEVGTRVRVSGVNAGEVVQVQPPGLPGDPVIVRMRLEGRYRSLIRSDATAQIVGEGFVGGRVIEISPGSRAAAPVADNATIASRPTAELAEVLDKVEGVLQDIRTSEGTLGKLMKDDGLYRSLDRMVSQGTRTLESIQSDADALKKMPVVRNYVEDVKELLVRPDSERYRQSFSESELFEPGQATLTAPGRERLDKLVPWLEGLKHKGSDMVVAAYAAPNADPELSRNWTRKQSEAVCNYLKDRHGVQKNGWFSRSWKLTPLGLGTSPPPQSDRDQLPPPRIEVLVFVPRG